MAGEEVSLRNSPSALGRLLPTSILHPENLPPPDVLAQEIVEDLEPSRT